MLIWNFQAYNCLEDLKSRITKVNVAYYVDMKVLEGIYAALNLPMKDVQGPKNSQGQQGYTNSPDEDGEEFVEEDVDDWTTAGIGVNSACKGAQRGQLTQTLDNFNKVISECTMERARSPVECLPQNSFLCILQPCHKLSLFLW